MDTLDRIQIEVDRPLGRLIDYIVRWYRKSNRNDAEGRALGALIAREVSRLSARAEKLDAGPPEELQRLLLHIDDRYRRGLTVKELAALIDRSRSHVLKLFRQHLGKSPKAYIIDRQLREACELLARTALSIAEVGNAVGLPDPYHFSRLFKRHLGLAPREFRAHQGLFALRPAVSTHEIAPHEARRSRRAV